MRSCSLGPSPVCSSSSRRRYREERPSACAVSSTLLVASISSAFVTSADGSTSSEQFGRTVQHGRYDVPNASGADGLVERDLLVPQLMRWHAEEGGHRLWPQPQPAARRPGGETMHDSGVRQANRHGTTESDYDVGATVGWHPVVDLGAHSLLPQAGDRRSPRRWR